MGGRAFDPGADPLDRSTDLLSDADYAPPGTDWTEPIRRARLEGRGVDQLAARARGELVAPNEKFAAYTQSTAFSLSLSKSQIRGLDAIDRAIAFDYTHARWPVSPTVVTALVRRGLVVELTGGDTGRWALTHQVPTAGLLVLQLLAEAGMVEARVFARPLPPPPPGWVDPRPAVMLDVDGGRIGPSRYEEHYGHAPDPAGA